MFVQFFVVAMANIYRVVAIVNPDGKDENVRYVQMNVKLRIVMEMVYVLMVVVTVVQDLKEMIANKVFIWRNIMTGWVKIIIVH